MAATSSMRTRLVQSDAAAFQLKEQLTDLSQLVFQKQAEIVELKATLEVQAEALKTAHVKESSQQARDQAADVTMEKMQVGAVIVAASIAHPTALFETMVLGCATDPDAVDIHLGEGI